MAHLDLTTPRTRRQVLGLLGGVGAAVALTACGSGGDDNASGTTATKRTTTTTGAGSASSTTAVPVITTCTVIPTETAGPYPGDGTNGPNVLTQDGVVRSDIRSSIGGATGVATGVPLTVDMTLVDTANGCRALPGAAVYLWACDAQGRYSMYSNGVTGENYLRGVQAADANGRVRFTTVFPAAYQGRWPHLHFEVFPTLASASNGNNKRAVSQLALPEDVCNAVYATAGYEQSVRNMAQTPLTRDMVFSDGVSAQTPTTAGDASAGYAASIVVGVGPAST